jgi:hypothetical protein
MNKKIIRKIARKIFRASVARKIKALGEAGPTPLMDRGKPDSTNFGPGMGEGVQKEYEGRDRSRKPYDQLQIIDEDCNDWVDTEAIIDDLTDTRTSKKSQVVSPYSDALHNYVDRIGADDNELEYYHKNPKGKGEILSDAIFAVDEGAMRMRNNEDLVNNIYVKDDSEYHRDETQKYPTNEQPIYRDKYWKENISPMDHSV